MNNLVYDVGMHEGEDTAFYLRRGFSVVGIEANPELIPRLERRFSAAIADGRLRIVGKAIAPTPQTVRFGINRRATVWSSLSPKFIERNVAAGAGDVDFVEVEAVPFDAVLREHGVPYYLKVDIEGMDMLCVRALHQCSIKPRYISIESSVTSGVAEMEAAFAELAELWVLGYRRFKYVDQAGLARLNGLLLDAEGPPLGYEHTAEGSGPFGEDSPGAWLSIDETLKQMRRLIRYQNTLGFGGRYCNFPPLRVARRLRRHLKGLSSHSWYDLHARLE